jgi:hypothetical protein
MYENCRQSLGVFLLAQSKQKLLDENDRLAKETQATELRHMIGYVAHDLKTVRVFCFVVQAHVLYLVNSFFSSLSQRTSAAWS